MLSRYTAGTFAQNRQTGFIRILLKRYNIWLRGGRKKKKKSVLERNDLPNFENKITPNGLSSEIDRAGEVEPEKFSGVRRPKSGSALPHLTASFFFFFSLQTFHVCESDPLLGEGQPERDREGEDPVRPRDQREAEEPNQLQHVPGEAVGLQRGGGRAPVRAQEGAHSPGG